jgi:hypothetical protein
VRGLIREGGVLRQSDRCGVTWAALVCLLCCAWPPPVHAQAQQPVAWSVTNTTRVESWSFFDPPPTGGNPDYTFVANRLSLGVARSWSRLDIGGSVQYVQFGGLPAHAVGPGPLGTGALYFGHSGRRDSRGVYLRTLSARARLPRGLVLLAGRFPYQSGAESASANAKIEAVKRARLDGRLIGEFEWSLYQRSFDGVRGDLDRERWHVSGAWFSPTQGGFEDKAGARLGGIQVGSLTFAARPSVAIPRTDLNVFGLRYDDDRPVTDRPDNSGRAARQVDVRITTLGGAAVGSAPAGPGEADWLVWFAGQTGSWYSQAHRAWSLAIEAGYQWPSPWRPWVRAGILRASGDDDAADDRHGTFFPMLPTVRKYAFTASYAPMNLQDVFVELIVRPAANVTARVDGRRLRLAHAADLWYAGSGAAQQRGSIFGYAGRRSGGATSLGTVLEGAANVTLGSHWSVNGFAGTIRGGDVVRTHFAGKWLRFVYLESVIGF